MKKLALGLIAIALSGSALLAQSKIVGTWQGALKLPKGGELRTVFKISMGNDVLKAAFYSIDQQLPAIPASQISFQGSTLKMAFAQIGGGFEGKLNPDGNSITGTFTQITNPIPLNLMRATDATAWTIPEPAPPPKAMAPAAKPVFEVATIKPSGPGARFSLLVGRNGMMNATNTSLSDLVKFAYGVHPRQITGAPAWIESDKYDVTAKPDTPGIPSLPQLRVMVQKLLSERFHLAFHRDKKELSVYTLTVGKTGAKMSKNESDPNGLPGFGGGGRGRVGVRNSTMAEFAEFLQSNILERPVLDQTGLAGARYDFTLAWTPDSPPPPGAPGNAPPPPDNADAPPDLFTAVQQQLGLRLESTKAPAEVLVIDKVEKPSEN